MVKPRASIIYNGYTLTNCVKYRQQICKEEESAIRIDIHEGCGRAKLFWLLLLVDRRTLKGLAEFRGMEGGVCDPAAADAAAPPGAPGLAGTCRFCGTRGYSGLLAIGNVCADQQCQVTALLHIVFTAVRYLLNKIWIEQLIPIDQWSTLVFGITGRG